MKTKARYAPPPKLPRENLLVAAILAANATPYKTFRAYYVAGIVIEHFLGEEWRRAQLGDESTTKFFPTQTIENDCDVLITRSVGLGELLFNLQYIQGFDERVQKLKEAICDPEAQFGEIEAGGLLGMWNHTFRFVDAVGREGRIYDIELTLPDGRVVPVEAKCKVETTDLSVNTLKESFDTAKDQFPKGSKGIVFMKIPQAWVMDGASANDKRRRLIETSLAEFMRRTSRIVSVQLYSNVVLKGAEICESGYRAHRIDNQREDCAGDWNLYNPQNPYAINPNWTRLFDFVGGSDGP